MEQTELTLSALDYSCRPENMADERLRFVVGISGGKDSTAVLLWMLHKSGIPRERIICTFADTGNEHHWTYEHIKKIATELHPVTVTKPERDFAELALWKKRFPSVKRRFCTQFLKIYPSEDFITKLKYDGFEPVSISGIRAVESDDRKNLPEWDISGWNIHYRQWRPLIRWNLEDVLAIHEEFNFPLNPLYEIGATRVGCFPCIMSNKREIRMIAQKFPERIDEIRRLELEFEKRYGRVSSFFNRNTVPARFRTHQYEGQDGEAIPFATIDDVVRWSMTGKGAKGSYKDEDPQQEGISCNSGFCE